MLLGSHMAVSRAQAGNRFPGRGLRVFLTVWNSLIKLCVSVPHLERGRVISRQGGHCGVLGAEPGPVCRLVTDPLPHPSDLPVPALVLVRCSVGLQF